MDHWSLACRRTTAIEGKADVDAAGLALLTQLRHTRLWIVAAQTDLLAFPWCNRPTLAR